MREGNGGALGSPEVLAGIRQTLIEEPSITFAFLFGSRAGGRPRADSDWDVGVDFDPTLPREGRARRRLELTGRLEEWGPIDLVPINDADPLLAHRVLGGQALFIKDESRYREVFMRTMRLAEDQRYFDRIFRQARTRRLAEGEFGRR